MSVGLHHAEARGGMVEMAGVSLVAPARNQWIGAVDEVWYLAVETKSGKERAIHYFDCMALVLVEVVARSTEDRRRCGPKIECDG